ncbi:MAG: hypothetical protein ACYCX9_07030 [Candidatus Dormibacteria bacterium]|jgi:hypothetical protein
MSELGPLSDPDQDFEQLASSLRADSGDLNTFLEVLATKFEGALPGRARIDYQGGGMLRRKAKAVRRIQVQLGDDHFELLRDGGAVVAKRTKVVRGIALKSEEMSLDGWVSELTRALLKQSEASSADRQALERLLG